MPTEMVLLLLLLALLSTSVPSLLDPLPSALSSGCPLCSSNLVSGSSSYCFGWCCCWVEGCCCSCGGRRLCWRALALTLALARREEPTVYTWRWGIGSGE